MSSVLLTGSSVAIVLYSMVGIFAYLTFVHDQYQITSNILDCPYGNNIAIIVVSIYSLLILPGPLRHVLCCYGISTHMCATCQGHSRGALLQKGGSRSKEERFSDFRPCLRLLPSLNFLRQDRRRDNCSRSHRQPSGKAHTLTHRSDLSSPLYSTGKSIRIFLHPPLRRSYPSSQVLSSFSCQL